MVGYTPEPWVPADTISVAKLMMYMGLGETQETLEKFIIEAVRIKRIS